MTPGGPLRQAVRRVGAVPAPAHGEDSYPLVRFRGLLATASHSLSTLHALKFVPVTQGDRSSDRPRKTRFRLVANLYRVGLLPTRLRYKVSLR